MTVYHSPRVFAATTVSLLVGFSTASYMTDWMQLWTVSLGTGLSCLRRPACRRSMAILGCPRVPAGYRS